MTVHESGLNACGLVASFLNRDASFVSSCRDGVPSASASHDVLACLVAQERQNMFADVPYFVSRQQIQRMADVIHAIETVISLPSYQEHVLARAPSIASVHPGARGVFFGYDFHVSDNEPPKLIEINTNAGGALLNTFLASGTKGAHAHEVEAMFVQMFVSEWRLQRKGGAPACVAIVDLNPAEQYLYPEFLMFKELFERHGIQAIIADPSELELRGDTLQARGVAVDLVYNRLTDFYFEHFSSASLRQAYQNEQVVVTPHPMAYAMYADKRALVTLTDDRLLHAWGVNGSIRSLLGASIPATVLVRPADGEALWQARRDYFFKPVNGYGSKGTYRGDKLTRRVWQEILQGEYVAQRFACPGTRQTLVGGQTAEMKVDIRNYVYGGQVQSIAARMFQGQTTNFRTPGGGFAPVVEVDDARASMLRLGNVAAETGSRGTDDFFNHGVSLSLIWNGQCFDDCPIKVP